MSIKEPKFRIMDVDKLPMKASKKREEWVSLLKSIPKGKALVSTEKDLGVRVATINGLVNEYVKKGVIPKGYRVARRTRGDNVDIYIIHDAEPEKKEAQ